LRNIRSIADLRANAPNGQRFREIDPTMAIEKSESDKTSVV
jgi:hypothetical protein